MKNDQLGMIANAHLGIPSHGDILIVATADYYTDGVKNPKCLGCP